MTFAASGLERSKASQALHRRSVKVNGEKGRSNDPVQSGWIEQINQQRALPGTPENDVVHDEHPFLARRTWAGDALKDKVNIMKAAAAAYVTQRRLSAI